MKILMKMMNSSLHLVRSVLRRRPQLMLSPASSMSSREEAEYWLERSKTQDAFPKQSLSKLDDLDEFGPRLSPNVFKNNNSWKSQEMFQAEQIVKQEKQTL